MIKELLPLCECGCGKSVAKKGNRFINGHNKNRLGSGKPKSEPQLCECGCGEYAKPGNRFIYGHVQRGRKHSQKTKDGISNTKKQYYINNPEAGRLHSEFMIQRFIDNPELGKNHSRLLKKYYKDPKNRDAASRRITEYFMNNPKAREAARLRSLEQWSDQEFHDMMVKIATERWANQDNRDIQSKTILNSKIAKAAQDEMRGGLDVVKHHHIYDHNDLSKYTIEMIRSQHGLLHRNMQLLDLKVPHINTGHENKDELKLMEYIKKVEFEPKGL